MSDVLEVLLKSGSNGARKRGSSIVDRQNDDFFALYPNVYRLLADRQIGGIKRDLSRLSIRLLPEGWVLALTEPATGQILFSQSDTLIKCFESLESRVGAEDADWREDKFARKNKPK